MKRFSLIAAAIAVTSAVVGIAPNASAATLCTDASVTANGFSYTACSGPLPGNDTGNQGTLLARLNGTGAFAPTGLFDNIVGDRTWSLFGKSDASGDTVEADNGDAKGDWSVSGITGPFVLSLKTSTSYSAYLFTGLTGTIQGLFDTIGVELAGQGNDPTKGKDLSHASIFVASGGTTPPPPQSVPEPSAMAALGLFAVGGLTALKKKK
ncbi:MAG: PEP-CTERM sorting domain-containing protein [Leptolyngbyaceae cyanobacterium bins.59]|nr:PEP-CTERM sorting domain-containing protein [Leptolyngbyaceae cyanobacterium bins.59]